MDTDKKAVRIYFAKLGLEHEIADIYLALHSQGPQNISQLSRNSGVERTRIYRLIDQLLDSNLIEVETHYKRGIVKAAPISNLQILISQKEQELKSLQDELMLFEKILSQNSLSSPNTRVQFYQGAEGVKQMFWNETRASTEIVGILYENMQNKTNSQFFERWVEKCNSTHITFRNLFGDHFMQTQRDWYADHQNERLKYWHGRYISPDIFPINHGMIIYDNLVGYFNWQNGEIFGIEICNQQIADSQRLLFEQLWQKGQDIDDLTGKAKDSNFSAA